MEDNVFYKSLLLQFVIVYCYHYRASLTILIKGIVMQIEKALINDCLRFSKLS